MGAGHGRERECRTSLVVAGRELPLLVRRHGRARRLTLRLDARGDGVVVTIPERASFADGVALARRHSAWVAERVESRPQRLRFADGVVLPLRGIDHEIRHLVGATGRIRVEDGRIVVAGQEDSLPARLEAWLRREARRDLEDQVRRLAPVVGRPVGRIGVRDTRSRWGSCSAAGNLSFSWRLILAPSPVLAYVAAHELAHLAHRDHGTRFWALAARLYGEGMADARAWLRKNGPGLHRYG